MPKTKRVYLILRDGWKIETPKVDVLWECPTCGKEMGEPRGRNFYEDGYSYYCDVWENECGHVAAYKDVKMKTKEGFKSWKEILEERKKST